MSNICEDLQKILDGFDQEMKPLMESEIQIAIRALVDTTVKPGDNFVSPVPLTAEAMAFEFWENPASNSWGTYYGPMSVLPKGDGTFIESPSLTKVTDQIIEYWIGRAQIAKHPILRARYADLVWDFHKIVTKKPAPYTMAQIVIDSIVEIAHGNYLKHESQMERKFERALDLALSLKDNDRVNTLANTIIAYEDLIAEDSKLGLWGFSYDLLIEKNKIKLTPGQNDKIIADLEGRLSRCNQPNNPAEINQWIAEAAASRLAKYYRKVGEKNNVRRVLTMMKDVFIQASSKGTALQASFWLQHLHGILMEYNLSEEAEEVAKLIKHFGEKASAELKPISTTVEIPTEKINKYIESLIDGKPEDVFIRIAIHYLPQKSKLENQLKELTRISPIQFLIPMEIQDSQGRPVAKIGSIDEDFDERIINLMARNIQMEQIFLRRVMEALLKKYPDFQKILLDYLFNSPSFEQNRKGIIELGVKDYIEGDYISAVHLLIPQIEHSIRSLLEKIGGSIYKSIRNGGFDVKILDELLREPLLARVFNEDFILYFRILLVDRRGINLRNCVSHGLCNTDDFGLLMADRIIHVLLCLALVHEQKSTEK